MSERMVKCSKFGEELPGMPFRPFPDDLGAEIWRNVSMKAWQDWLRESPRIINTYRVDLQSAEGRDFLRQQMRVFFGLAEGDLAETAWRPPSDGE